MNNLNQELLEAACEGNVNEVKRLIVDGADVNASDDYGWTALMIAAGCGHTETCEMLIAKGADVNVGCF